MTRGDRIPRLDRINNLLPRERRLDDLTLRALDERIARLEGEHETNESQALVVGAVNVAPTLSLTFPSPTTNTSLTLVLPGSVASWAAWSLAGGVLPSVTRLPSFTGLTRPLLCVYDLASDSWSVH